MAILGAKLFRTLAGKTSQATSCAPSDLSPKTEAIGQRKPSSWASDIFALGGFGTVEGQHDFSSISPQFLLLTPADARELEAGSGLVERGKGELVGKILMRPRAAGTPTMVAMSAQEPVLVTRFEGSRAEVNFALDISPKEAKSMLGQRVCVDAEWERQGAVRGKARGAKVVRTLSATDVQVGDRVHVQGRVGPSMGKVVIANGYHEPDGKYLTLKPCINVGDTEVSRIFLRGGDDLALHQHLIVSGKLQLDEISPGDGGATLYLELSSTDGLLSEQAPPEARVLDRGILEDISQIMGFQIQGKGVLQGELCMRPDEFDGDQMKPFLATFRLGAESGFFVDLDAKQAKKFQGKTVQIGGLIRNGIDKTNTITSAKIQSVLPDRLALTTGDRAELQGLVFASALSAKVGAAPPSDTRVLVLEDYVFINGKRTQELYLKGGDALPVGAKIRLSGEVQGGEQPVLSDLRDLAQAPGVNVFSRDAETLINDFSHVMGPRLRVVVPEDQTID